MTTPADRTSRAGRASARSSSTSRRDRPPSPPPSQQTGCGITRQQLIYTASGPLEVGDLCHQSSFIALCHDGPGTRYRATEAVIRPAGRAEVVRVQTDKGPFEIATGSHMWLSSGGTVVAGELPPKRSLFACTIDEHNGGYPRVSLWDGAKGRDRLHRIVARDLMGMKDGQIVHHKDGDKLNNMPSNLQLMDSQAKHARLHSEQLVEAGEHPFQLKTYPKKGEKNGMHSASAFYQDDEKVEAYKEKQRQIMLEERDPVAMQKKSTIQRYINTGWKLINAGHDIPTMDAFFDSYKQEIGRIDSKPRRRKAFKKWFGSYQGYLKALAEANHRVQSVEILGRQLVYVVEEAESSGPAAGFVIWPRGHRSMFGQGIAVSFEA